MGLGIRNFCRNAYASTLLGGVLLVIALCSVTTPVHAAAGINQQINFQGRLLNGQGAIVPDGYYNMEFKIYTGGDGQSVGDTTPSGSAGTLLWTEDYVDNNANAGVQVQNGYMSIQLGSICAFSGGTCQGHTNTAVNWNSDTLWLSMNIAGSANTCTSFNSGSCIADGEMVPMKRMSANAYALNSQQLGGLTSGQFVQLAQGLQTDATTNTSIYINKTSTGNFIDYQTSGVDSFIINNSGNEVFGANASHSISVATAAASTAGQALSVSAGAAGTGASALAGGTLTLDGGAGGGTNGNGGNLVLDAGAANGSGTAGTITIGSNNASNITLGNSSNTTQAKVQAGGATSTLTNSGGEAVQGTDSTNATNAMKVTNGSGSTLFQLVDDGTVNLGLNSSNSYAFGYNTIGTNGQDSGYHSLISGNKFTASSTGTISAISVYVGANVSSSPNNQYQVGIYSDSAGSPGSLIASSTVGTLTAGSWNTMAVSASVSASTAYWLVYTTNVASGAGTANGLDYTSASSGNTHFYATFTFGSGGGSNGMPSSITGATIVNNLAESMYASSALSAAFAINNQGVITTQTTFQNTANSTAALVVQNSSGNRVLDVDTTNNQVVLGQASQVNGVVQFQSTGGGYVALAAPSIASGASYSLTLPTAAPTAANQCLQSGGTFTQLTFAACINASGFISNGTTTQAANYNIQGTSSTAATAVIEANNGGSGDILDLNNGAGTPVATFDKNGNFVDSATGSSSFAGTLTVSTKVVSPSLDTASSVPLNIGSSASQVNLNQNVQITGNTTYASGANRSISVGTPASGNGNNLNVSAGAGAAGNNNGGNAYFDAGAKTGTGTDGTVNVGTNHASTVNIGNSTSSTTVAQTAGGATSTLSNGGGEAIVGSGTTNGTTALKVSNSGTVSLFQIADDGTVDLGVNSLNNPALIINTSGQITTATTVNSTSATALLVQSSSTGQVLDVDTSANQVNIGQAGHVNGLIALQSSTSGGGYVGFAAPSITSANSYTLTLPTAAPTATNQCLQSSATATQLTFGACGTTGSFINNAYGTTQTANFNIKGASATTTTAVIASDGADILDLMNSSAVAVATFDQNGNFVDSATGSSSFAGTLTVATKVVTPTLDTASSVPLNIGASSSQINLNQNVQITGNTTYAAGANRSISVAAAASGNGNNLSVNAGAGASGNNNGGNVNIDAGAKTGTGTDGTVNIGTNHASAINIGTSGVTTTNNGNEAVNGTITTGQSGSSNGSVAFNNANSHTVTLNSTGGTSTYTLTLPTSAPAAGLCLETAPGAASQLVFASCTNNNSSIQEVQEVDANNTNVKSFTPTTIGDEIVVMTQIPTSSVTVSSISDSDVTTWNKVGALNGNGTVNRVEMWVGTVTSLATQNLTVTYSSSPGANEIAITEFTAAGVNASTSWGIESSSTQLNSIASATVTYPTATAVDGSELYIGYAQVQNPPATVGSYPNFSYIQTSTQHNMIAYDTDLSANTTYTPTANQNSAGESNTIDAVLTAFVTSTSINNTTSLQKANFYVQAASSGTVAGILQAASSGTADIFDIKNGAGTINYLQVGSTGNLTLNAATSTTAVQVLNGTSGNAVFSVDTTNNQAVLGSSNHIAGTLTFDDTSDTNSISLQAPSSIAASYTLALPNNSPTAGLCLGTSPSNANQLIFASCATQVSAAGISYVSKWQNTGTGNTNITDSPVTKGDLLVLFSHTTGNATISGVSGGGVGSWTKVTTYNSAGGAQGNAEMWRGVVTTTGSGTIAITYTGTVTASDVVAEEFTMGSNNGTWAIDTSGTQNATTGTTINYPTLTPQNSSELYTGYAWGANTMSAGTTTGFTYLADAASKYLAYNPSVTGGTAYTPTASQSTTGAYASIAAAIEAYAGTSVIVDTTATQEANFNVQAATAGTVGGVIQAASSGTADILDLRDSSGNNIAAFNSASGMTLGTSSAVGGQINFNASGNNNTITIQAPTAPGSSYSLTLPTTTPAPGQCLASSPSNANQLVFSSCANQVTSVSISFVNHWNELGTGNTQTLSVSPTNLGDLMVVFSAPQKGNAVTSVTGGGVAVWARVTSSSGLEMWRGQVTSTGTSNITVNMTGATGNNEVDAMEFTSGSATGSWVIDTSGTLSNGASTTITYPNLTPQSTKDLYAGFAQGAGTTSAGSTTGFTYLAANQAANQMIYNTSVSTTIQPTGVQSSTSASLTIGALVAAYSSSSVIANSTSTQEANFNVQAATSGSVAGVLQAFPTGSGDTLDLLDGSGNKVDTFGNTGNVLIEPSTASASALQVQTTGAVNVFSVDTSAKLVNIGKGATGESSPSLLVLDNETGTTADPTESDGAMYYNATTKAMRCGVDGSWTNCNSLLYANTSASSVNNNCSNNCVAFSTSTAIPANYCQAGRVIDLYANGYFSSQSTATTLQFGIYYGTDSSIASNDTLIGTLSPSASVTSASSNYFQMNYNINCFSTSSMQSGGLLDIQTGSSGSGMLALPMGASTTTTVVTSSAKNLYIFPIWGTASTSNTATLSQMNLNTY